MAGQRDKNRKPGGCAPGRKDGLSGRGPANRNPAGKRYERAVSREDVSGRGQAALDSDDVLGLIIGRNPVMEALKSGKAIDTVYVSQTATGSIASVTRIARERGIVVKTVTDRKLTEMCGETSHQGVIASGACAEYVTVEEILEISRKKGTPPFIII